MNYCTRHPFSESDVFHVHTFSQGVQVQGKYKEMQELRRQEQSRQQRILKAREELAAAELDLQNVPAYEPPHDKIVCVVSNFDLLLSSGSARLDVV